MPYPRNSPLKDKTIRQMVTAACYAEISTAAGGEWNPSQLEELIDGKKYWEQAGRYRRLARGVVPSNDTANRLQERLNSKCHIIKWRDHPFWKLLSLNPLTHNDIELALLSVTCNAKYYIWSQPPSSKNLSTYRYLRFTPKKDLIAKIAKYRNFDALITLVAYAREGRDSGMMQQYAVSARYCLEIFPYVVARNPHLFICWKPLAARLKRLIWKPKPSFLMEPAFNATIPKLSKLIEPLADFYRNKGICLPPQDVLLRFN